MAFISRTSDVWICLIHQNDCWNSFHILCETRVPTWKILASDWLKPKFYPNFGKTTYNLTYNMSNGFCCIYIWENTSKTWINYKKSPALTERCSISRFKKGMILGHFKRISRWFKGSSGFYSACVDCNHMFNTSKWPQRVNVCDVIHSISHVANPGFWLAETE